MPSYAVVYSLNDPVGSGAASKLTLLAGAHGCRVPRARTCWVLETVDAILVGFEEDVLFFDFLDEVVPGGVRAYVVLSRHSSASGEPTLSLHHPGNPGPRADHGGRPWELAYSYPSLAKTLALAYRRVAEEAGLLETYQFTLEATHHGPTGLLRPIVFVEIGSTEDRWRDPRAQEALARAVLEALERGPTPCRPVVGVGDTHYPRVHTRIMLETENCYGHILARYTFQNLNRNLLVQAARKSVDGTRAFVVQKPPSRVRRLVEEVARELGVEVVRA